MIVESSNGDAALWMTLSLMAVDGNENPRRQCLEDDLIVVVEARRCCLSARSSAGPCGGSREKVDATSSSSHPSKGNAFKQLRPSRPVSSYQLKP
jgi:hypothetical protein